MFMSRYLLMHFEEDPLVLNSIVTGSTVLEQKNRILNSSGTVQNLGNIFYPSIYFQVIPGASIIGPLQPLRIS
jgi:hypothetical protein